MMELFFVRHAHAEEGKGVDDHHRRLTDEGVKAAKAVADLFNKLGIHPTRLYSSPRIRAKQTAEIIAETLKLTVELREEVNFGFNVPGVDHLMQDAKDQDVVMFVGHEPSMSATIGEIIGGQTPARIQVKKSGFARVEITSRKPLRGELVWLVAPRLLGGVSE